MKAGIHPTLHPVVVHCACGAEFETLSTQSELRLEICGSCHPHYTGQKRAIAARGRVQQFEQKYAEVDAGAAAEAKAKKKARAVRTQGKRRKA
jgi:large subunit ribosomal protein L31